MERPKRHVRGAAVASSSRRGNPAELFTTTDLPHVKVFTVKPYECLHFAPHLQRFAKTPEFLQMGALVARLPPELNLGGSLSDLNKLETATVTVKRQTVHCGRMIYTEDIRPLHAFMEEARDIEKEIDTRALLEHHMLGGRSAFAPNFNHFEAPYASEARNIEVMDPALESIHPDTFGQAVRVLTGQINIGISTSLAYFGAATSIFCTHTENACLNSINILVDGAPKVWLVCAPGDSPKVEAILAAKMRKGCHHMALKRVLVSPQELHEKGVKMFKVIQKKGDVVVTAPNSYHLGFNAGLNLAISSNTVLDLELWRKEAELTRTTKSVVWPGNPCHHCNAEDGLDVQAMLEKAQHISTNDLFPDASSGIGEEERPAAPPLAASPNDLQQGTRIAKQKKPSLTSGVDLTRKKKTKSKKALRKMRCKLREDELIPVVPQGIKEEKKSSFNFARKGTISRFNYIMRNRQKQQVIEHLQNNQSSLTKHLRGELPEFKF